MNKNIAWLLLIVSALVFIGMLKGPGKFWTIIDIFVIFSCAISALSLIKNNK
jgi:hypothetical protein